MLVDETGTTMHLDQQDPWKEWYHQQNYDLKLGGTDFMILTTKRLQSLTGKARSYLKITKRKIVSK